MLLFMNHCNDFAPCGPSIGQYNSYSYGPIIFFRVDRGRIQTFSKEGANRGPNPEFSVVFKGFLPKRGPAPSCTAVDCAPSPMLYNPVLDVSIS